MGERLGEIADLAVVLHLVLLGQQADLQAVEGIGSIWARHIREGLSRLAETSIERYE